MSLARIAGMGWVTPLGADVGEVWAAIQAGTPPPVAPLENPRGHALRAALVPPALVAQVARHPRLRRASNISLFASSAALAALQDAGVEVANPGRLAIVQAVSDGGAIYTRKFYDQVVRDGAGSPMFFPDTVYNAPASHVAHLLGLDGATYTLVGDASAAMAALQMGAELIASGQADQCLVLAAEEADWILAEAYRQWRVGGGGAGVLLGEGAAALVLAREGARSLEAVCAGVPIFGRKEAAASLRRAVDEAGGSLANAVSRCANGGFADSPEIEALGGEPAVSIYPKRSLGESMTAGALMQVICAAKWRETGEGTVLVPVVGLNHQAAAARVG